MSDRHLRVLVAIHQLDLGGSPINAVDLASGVRDHGHEVLVTGPPGALVDVIEARGLPYEPAPLQKMEQSAGGYKRLLEVTRAFRPDLVHSYELIPSLLAYFGSHGRDGTPLTMTINSMSVPDFMPGSVPLQVCSPLIAYETKFRPGPVGVMEIPTDTTNQRPDFPGGDFRAEVGVTGDELLVVAVSRFARVLKQQGLETLIRATARLAPRHKMKLAVVGDGPAMPDLRALADGVNGRLGREVVVLTGERSDPRPAYAAADVVVGMAGSLLRAMAFGKPGIVQGEDGYWETLDPASLHQFRWRGFYGIGRGGSGEDRLVELLGRLLDDDVLRKENGAFALELVRRYYSLDHAISEQLKWYDRVLAETSRPTRAEMSQTALAVSRWVAKREALKVVGENREDYFNSSARIGPGIKAPAPDWFVPKSVGQ
jgi:hypothetical protein